MNELCVGVVSERAGGEARVALIPPQVRQLRDAGIDVLIEPGAGALAWHPDSAYEQAGATLADRASIAARADVLVSVARPDDDLAKLVPAGHCVLGLLRPLDDPGFVADLAARSVTAISLDLLPRTLSRAQAMDAVTSQSNIAGYKAVLVAANAFGRFFPMLVTAAGTTKPASVLVLGAGVAGLQAIGTARRLGAVVSSYDVRPQARDEVASLGATFLDLGALTASGAGEGGYARALTADEQAGQQRALAEAIGRFDIVITTALVPGRRPPLLVSEQAVAALAPGSVVVDLAAGALGGNVASVRAGQTFVNDGGVTIMGAANLAASMPAAASAALSRNIAATLTHLIRDGALNIDLADEIQAGIVVAHDGAVVSQPVLASLDAAGSHPAMLAEGADT